MVSGPFRTERLSGRVFFSELDNPSAELMALTRIVAREVGVSLDHWYAADQLREVAAGEERMRVARDLHDGVLQALTGVRLQLQTIATGLDEEAPGASRDRLLAIERAVALEQRELRLFIEGLRPAAPAVEGAALATRLNAVGARLGEQWKVPVTVRVRPASLVLSSQVEQPVTLMVQEAIINALKHAHPTRISADVHAADGRLHIVVRDDGRGFPFTGHFDQAALLRAGVGPLSLRERVAALGGEMTIESSGLGSSVSIALRWSEEGVPA
jgi:signal transduction histidine kinase